jgi:copper chaperone
MEKNINIGHMEKLQFKTNINCSGCVAKVTPFLDGEERIGQWTVHTAHPQKVLIVEVKDMTAEEVQALLAKAGFKGEPLAYKFL